MGKLEGMTSDEFCRRAAGSRHGSSQNPLQLSFTRNVINEKVSENDVLGKCCAQMIMLLSKSCGGYWEEVYTILTVSQCIQPT